MMSSMLELCWGLVDQNVRKSHSDRAMATVGKSAALRTSPVIMCTTTICAGRLQRSGGSWIYAAQDPHIRRLDDTFYD